MNLIIINGWNYLSISLDTASLYNPIKISQRSSKDLQPPISFEKNLGTFLKRDKTRTISTGPQKL